MRIKPILFSTPMVRAIMDRRKTVTRRLPDKRIRQAWKIYQQNIAQRRGMNPPKLPLYVYDEKEFYEVYPPYHARDVLWVREPWARWSPTPNAVPKLCYRADDNTPSGIKWRSSIYMPKEAARLFLRVTRVKLEHLRNISVVGVAMEGIDITGGTAQAYAAFSDLWDSLRKPADIPECGWDANPWVGEGT